MSSLHEMSAVALRALLLRGEVSPLDVVQAFLDRVRLLDLTERPIGTPRPIGAFTELSAVSALERARSLTQTGMRLPHSAAQHPLWGLALADKDLYDRSGSVTRYGSRVHATTPATETHPMLVATDTAGAVSIGRTSTPEFGLSGYTEPDAGRPALNPWKLSRNAGGSSGGAAAAVASGMLPFAVGTDGGGSVRIPAASCGLVGMKLSRDLFCLKSFDARRATAADDLERGAPELDLVVPGPIAHSVADAALLVDGLLGGLARLRGARHPYASGPGRNGTSATPLADSVAPAKVRSGAASPGRLRVGVLQGSPWDAFVQVQVSVEAAAQVSRIADLLDEGGHDVRSLRLPDSVEYGQSFSAVWQMGAAGLPIPSNRIDEVEPLTQWLIRSGRALPRATKTRALRYLHDYGERVTAAFAPWDVVLTPALALTARPNGWFDTADARRNFAEQGAFTPFTSFVNVSGAPAIVIPTGLARDGLPLGVQLIGRLGHDDHLLRIAAEIERLAAWSGHPWLYP
ncbi:amidase [Pseudoclavibacter sp. CFCC 13796]|uniref:amidase n=1 Tax=Pseudoclavibacter sp. CFCC 13796 TaxID=2615179 RepID=UPI001301775A|nr:amidase [Pseudoclavibacter sp. CFCC 13796]KAB1661988.1 amidase [Pseudoclavibacter sp. CFCC 13796]